MTGGRSPTAMKMREIRDFTRWPGTRACASIAGDRIYFRKKPKNMHIHAHLCTKSEQTAKRISAPAPGAPPSPRPVQRRPWGGDGFVCSKSMHVHNPFSTNNLRARTPARNHHSRARSFRTGAPCNPWPLAPNPHPRRSKTGQRPAQDQL